MINPAQPAVRRTNEAMMSSKLTTFFPFHKKPRAQGMVEFALVIPIFLVLVLGVLEMGRLLFVYSAVFTASREAARYGAAVGIGPNGRPYFQDCAGMRAQAKKIGSLAGLQDGNITIIYDNPDTSKNPSLADPAYVCDDLAVPAKPVAANIELGDRVIVRINYAYQPIVGFLGLPTFNINSTARRTILREVRFDGPTPLPSLVINAQTASVMTATSSAITATAGYHLTATSVAHTATAAFQQTGTSSAITATAASNQTATATAITATAAFEQTGTAAFQQTGTAQALTATASYEQTLTAMPTITPTPTATFTPTLTPTPKPTAVPTLQPACPEPQPFTVAASGPSFTITIDNTAPDAKTLVLDHLHIDWQSYGTVHLQQIETHLANTEDPAVVVWTGSTHFSPAEIDDWATETGAPTILPGQIVELTFTFDQNLTVTDPLEWWVRLVFSGNCVNTWKMEN